MRDHVALGVDIAGLTVLVLAVWLVAYRRSLAGLVLATLGIAALAAMASLRALPSPSRDELTASITAVSQRLSQQKQYADELQQKNALLSNQLTQQTNAVRSLEEKAGELESRVREHEAARRQSAVDAFEWLTKALARSHYSIHVHEDDEWIEGNRGVYYRVRLHDPQTRKPFVFARGEYRAESQSALRRAFAKFESEIIKSLPAGWSTRLFLRGGATIEPLMSTTGPLGVEFGAVTYRRQGEKGRYSTLLPAQPFPAQTTNADLPLLRAAEYRAILFGALRSDVVELLHREPAGSEDMERGVEIVLYVKPD